MSRASLGIVPMVTWDGDGSLRVRLAETTAEYHCSTCGGSGYQLTFGWDHDKPRGEEIVPAMRPCACARTESVDAGFSVMVLVPNHEAVRAGFNDARMICLHASGAGVLDRSPPASVACTRTGLGAYRLDGLGLSDRDRASASIHVVADERPGNTYPRRWTC